MKTQPTQASVCATVSPSCNTGFGSILGTLGKGGLPSSLGILGHGARSRPFRQDACRYILLRYPTALLIAVSFAFASTAATNLCFLDFWEARLRMKCACLLFNSIKCF